MIRRVLWAAFLVAIMWMSPVSARELEISGSAAYWTESSSALSVTLGKLWNVAGFQLGTRVGFAYVTSPNSAGIPADLVARLPIGGRSPEAGAGEAEQSATPEHKGPRFYVEGQIGAWFLFVRSPVVRFHATGGGGIDLGLIRLGVEAGYLHNGALFGARVSLDF